MTSPQRRVRIQWTETAKKCLKDLPPKVRKGLLEKADELYDCDDPRRLHKPLTGPLAGYYRITYARYRAVYRVEEEQLASGDAIVTVTVLFVAAGLRKEHSKDDVYRVAQRIVELGIIDVRGSAPPEEGRPG